MAGTFSQIYIHVIFSVKGRENLLDISWRDELFKYMSGIIINKRQKPIIINGTENHVHIFLGLTPTIALSDLIREVKSCSSKFINENKFKNYKFVWQDGFGAYSYSRSHIDNVYNYIKNQEEHHKTKTFEDEYLGFLKKYEVEFDSKYVFD